MDVLDLLDEAEKWVSTHQDLCDYCDKGYEDATCECATYISYLSKLQKLENIRALIDVAKAARDLRSDIARTVDLSLDWSYGKKATDRYRKSDQEAAISTIVDANHLMAFVNALQQLDGGGDE